MSYVRLSAVGLMFSGSQPRVNRRHDYSDGSHLLAIGPPRGLSWPLSKNSLDL